MVVVFDMFVFIFGVCLFFLVGVVCGVHFCFCCLCCVVCVASVCFVCGALVFC